MSDRITRRLFLGSTAPAALGAGVMAGGMAATRAKASPLGANERINVGVIGTGNRGSYLTYIFDIVGSQTAAICDVNRRRLEKTLRDISHGKAKTYTDYRRLLDDKSIDAVAIATNGHWKALAAIEACLAGKDVYLEKPVATSIGEGRAIVEAAKKSGRIIQMGTQQHSWEHYRRAVQIIRSGKLGNISRVEVWDVENFHPGFGNPPDEPEPDYLDWDFWVGPSPRRPYNPLRYAHHYWFFDYGGAWQLEWGVHHYDIVHWAMGVDRPVAATGTGGRFAFGRDKHRIDWPDTFEGTCTYPPGPVAKNGFLLTYTLRSDNSKLIEGRRHGTAFYGGDGTLVIDRAGYQIFSETRAAKKVVQEEEVLSGKPEHEVVQAHARRFLDCMRSRKQPEANIEVGHLATNPGHLMNLAWRVGRPVKWDSATEQAIGDDAASSLIAKKYRAPWRLSSP